MSVERIRGGSENLVIPEIEKKLWKGNDIALASPTFIPARRSQLASFVIDPANFVSFDPSKLDRTHISMRSRLAQAGLDISHFGQQLAHFMVVNGIDVTNQPFAADIMVDNYSQRPIDLSSGARICRPFYEGTASALTGQRLLELEENGDIKIEGEENVDWAWRRENGHGVTGVYIRISDKKLWIPPHPTNKALIVYDDDGFDNFTKLSGFDYRKQIDEALQPAPQTDRPILWIGETKPRITLSENVNGILHSAVVQTITGKGSHIGFHINSHMIDGGRTDWPVRVEVLSPTVPEKLPHFVYMSFAAA